MSSGLGHSRSHHHARDLAGCWSHVRRKFSMDSMPMAVRPLHRERLNSWHRCGASKRPCAAVPAGAGEYAPRPIGTDLCRAVHSLAPGAASPVGQIQAGRSDPLRHQPTGDARAPPGRRNASRSLISLSAPSDPRPSQERTRCPPALMVAAPTWVIIATLVTTPR